MKTLTETRFKNLSFKNVANSAWLFYNMENEQPAQIGVTYFTKNELLADMERFAISRSYELKH